MPRLLILTESRDSVKIKTSKWIAGSIPSGELFACFPFLRAWKSPCYIAKGYSCVLGIPELETSNSFIHVI